MWKIKPYKKCQNLLEGFICPIDTGRLMGDTGRLMGDPEVLAEVLRYCEVLRIIIHSGAICYVTVLAL